MEIMTTLRLLAIVAVGLVCGHAQAQTNSIDQQPLAVNPTGSDEVLSYQPGQSPHTRKMTLSQILSLVGSTGDLAFIGALSVAGPTTLLQNTGRDLTFSDGTTFANMQAANNFPIFSRSPFEVASLAPPQNNIEFKLLGASGNVVTLSGAQTYKLMDGSVNITGTTSANLNPYQLSAIGSVAANMHVFTASATMGTGASGPYTALFGQTTVSGTGITNANPVGGQFGVVASSNVGGTSGAPSGRAYGFYSQVGLNSGATFWALASGGEIDIGIPTGASTAEADGLSLVLLGSHATHGLNNRDSGLIFGSANPTTGWDYGIRFGGTESSSPFMSTASLIWVGRTMTLGYGWDASNATFTSGFLKSTGFLVDGGGIVTAAGYKVAAATGVTCSGTPTSSFTSASGIVTHC